MKNWLDLYENIRNTYGYEPENLLIEYIDFIDKKKVLDLGVGTGRNSLFLSSIGCEVKGVDISEHNIEKYLHKANELGLSVRGVVEDIRTLEIEDNKYSLIIVSWVLNFFNKDEIDNIIEKIKKGLKSNGVVYFSVFSTKDDFYISNIEKLTKEKNTLYFEHNDTYRHYYTKEEVVEYFKELELLTLKNAMVLDIDERGNHYHDIIEYIGRKSN